LRSAEAWLSAKTGADTDGCGGRDQHNDAQQPRSRPEFRHGTLAVLGAPPFGLVISSMQTLVPQFAAASRLSDLAATVAMGGPRVARSPWCLQGPGPAFCEPSFQILSVNSETISHQRTLFQITLFLQGLLSKGQLLLICTL
jgi:hypothetical protein